MQAPIQIELSLGIMFHSVNCYLIPGKQLTLLDCGMASEENWLAFQEQIQNHGYKTSDIEQIIISHEHQDHIGLLPKILEQSTAIVKAPKTIKRWFSEPEEMKEQYLVFAKKLFKTLGFPKDLEKKAVEFIEQVRTYPKFKDLDRFHFFEEGDTIDMGNSTWKILNTPGHCPTQFVFVQEDEQGIFSSDMLLPLAPMPIVSEDPNQANRPIRALKNLIDSFHRLKAYNFQTIYPGHGPIFTDANAIIDKQLARIQVRKKQCLELYQSGHRSVYEIHQKMYPSHHIPPNFSGIHMILGYLDLLKEEGKI